ncbi:MAG: Uncharacterised protein [Halieaceae bacterium]|nr:MAG: Uncharacterised protein [Halieaceae bacterium]
MLFYGHAFGCRKVWQVSLTQLNFHSAALGDTQRVFKRLWNVSEQGLHFFSRSQILLFGKMTRTSWVVEGTSVANTDSRFVGLKLVGRQKTYFIGSNYRAVRFNC